MQPEFSPVVTLTRASGRVGLVRAAVGAVVRRLARRHQSGKAQARSFQIDQASVCTFQIYRAKGRSIRLGQAQPATRSARL